MSKQRDPRFRGNVDMLFHPADFRFHIGAAEVSSRGINRHVQAQLPGMLCELQAEIPWVLPSGGLSSRTNSAAGHPFHEFCPGHQNGS